ncbi:MAG TPA: hypothetical protein VFU02_10825, partial [Polyangiaceae bacterium]|nr:hypothetical protein [Polyangiaceae bacterium]
VCSDTSGNAATNSIQPELGFIGASLRRTSSRCSGLHAASFVPLSDPYFIVQEDLIDAAIAPSTSGGATLS